jgi:hypothetical protein
VLTYAQVREASLGEHDVRGWWVDEHVSVASTDTAVAFYCVTVRRAFVLNSLFNTYPSPQLSDHRAVERQSHRMQMLHSDRTPYLEGQSVKIFLDKTHGETVAYTSSLGHRHLVPWAM